jgi:hypothetical protein
MVAFRYAALALVLLLFGCATIDPKPVEVDMPTTSKHFIVRVDGVEPAR